MNVCTVHRGGKKIERQFRYIFRFETRLSLAVEPGTCENSRHPGNELLVRCGSVIEDRIYIVACPPGTRESRYELGEIGLIRPRFPCSKSELQLIELRACTSSENVDGSFRPAWSTHVSRNLLPVCAQTDARVIMRGVA